MAKRTCAISGRHEVKAAGSGMWMVRKHADRKVNFKASSTEGDTRSGQKDERRRAQVRAPAHEEIRQGKRIDRFHEPGVGGRVERIHHAVDVVEGHEEHDESAHNVQGGEASSVVGVHRDASGRAGTGRWGRAPWLWGSYRSNCHGSSRDGIVIDDHDHSAAR